MGTIDEIEKCSIRKLKSECVKEKLKLKLGFGENKEMKVLNCRVYAGLLDDLKQLTKYKYEVDRSTLIRIALYLITRDELTPLVNGVINEIDWVHIPDKEDSFDQALLECIEHTDLYKNNLKNKISGGNE